MFAPAAYGDLLGTAGSFAVLGGSTVTNTGATVLTGDLGLDTGSSITNPAGSSITVNGTFYSGTGTLSANPPNVDIEGTAVQAQSDLTTAYLSLDALAPKQDLSGQDLGGLTLTAGVYKFDSSALMTGTLGALTLNFQDLSNQFFVFQIGTQLTTSSGPSGGPGDATVTIENPGSNDGVYWVVGNAVIGTYSQFEGNILSYSGIVLETGATIGCGRALNQIPGSVTMDTNTISTGCAGVPGEGSGGGLSNLEYVSGSPSVPVPGVPGAFEIATGPGGPSLPTVPEPSALLLLATCIAGLAIQRKWARSSKPQNHGAYRALSSNTI